MVKQFSSRFKVVAATIADYNEMIFYFDNAPVLAVYQFFDYYNDGGKRYLSIEPSGWRTEIKKSEFDTLLNQYKTK